SSPRPHHDDSRARVVDAAADVARIAERDIGSQRARADAVSRARPEADTNDDVQAAGPAAAASLHGFAVSLTTAGYWTERGVRAMGSSAHILAGDTDDATLQWALDELERLERCWSRFRSDSELCALNACTGRWVGVSAPMLLALRCAADLYAATNGRFDPTILDALEYNGYDRSFELIDTRLSARPAASCAPGLTIEFDEDESRVRLAAGARVDLGGVGKGLAADLVARGLVDRGARSVLVNMGGDVRARGEVPPDGVWRVPVAHPLDADGIAFVHALDNDAVVTSTTRIRQWRTGDEQQHHLVDPATGRPARSGVAAVVASARDAWWAEGVAKAALIAGVDDGRALCAALDVRAWFFTDDGEVVAP
ncbi:MAG TPA: FAD:protein FMN transferase, partial [Acidimicrobiia bacterium]|nr:FAD:protein FMN transferase [Acidimicrobiia bacterium]